MTQTIAISPLLRGEGLPDYSAITPELVKRDIPQLLRQLDTDFTDLEKRLAATLETESPLAWETVMEPLRLIGERLRWSWGVVSHLNGVCNSSELRAAHAEQQPEVVRLSNRLGQSRTVHAALTRLRDAPAEPLTPARVRILKSELLSMQQRGVALTGGRKSPSTKPVNAWQPSPPVLATTFSMPHSSGP